MRKFILVMFGFFFLLPAAVNAQTQTLDLTSIGTFDTTNTYYTTYDYEGENPVLSGVAAASADVDITIDDELESVTANTLGVWTYTPTTLVVGEHEVVIDSDDESLEFTLTITASAGKGGVATPTTPPDRLLDSGIGDYTYVLIALGILGIMTAGVVALKN